MSDHPLHVKALILDGKVGITVNSDGTGIELVQVNYDQVNDYSIGSTASLVSNNQTSSSGIVASTNLVKYKALAMTNTGFVYADASNIQHINRVVGIITINTSQGLAPLYQNIDIIENPSWNFQTNVPIFLGLNGDLMQSVPTKPIYAFSLCLGIAYSPTKIFIDKGEYYIL